MRVSASEPYVVEEYSACLNFPPWCKKLVTKIRNDIRTQNLVKARIVDKCCEGYTKDGNHCVPLCQDGCIYGTCISPNTCHCYGNYEGSRCDLCKYESNVKIMKPNKHFIVHLRLEWWIYMTVIHVTNRTNITTLNDY